MLFMLFQTVLNWDMPRFATMSLRGVEKCQKVVFSGVFCVFGGFGGGGLCRGVLTFEGRKTRELTPKHRKHRKHEKHTK